MKKILKVVPIIIACIFIFNSSILANNTLGNGVNQGILDSVTANNTSLSSKFSTTFSNVFGTIFRILKILCVMGIAYNGVKYMYAGAQDKAKIKQSLLYIAIGTVCVFGADIIINVVANAWEKV